MKQIEKIETEVTYCDWCHNEISTPLPHNHVKENGSGIILHLHKECLTKYKELKSKEVRTEKE